MSLFRTLQNSPATISIFHNARVPALAKMFAQLEKAYYRSNDGKDLFQLDVAVKQMPTYDQFKLIYSKCIHSDAYKQTLKQVYPLLNDRVLVQDHKSVLFKSSGMHTDRGFKVFSHNEYERIREAFSELVNSSEPETDPSQLFRAPLIVDWDQNLIACDEDGLAAILIKYELSDNALSTA
ncbi:DUF1687-domain-containing protein [Metschnikowia bicuspidata]|uniref:DUF1687-domain-containing protein n=1 Tax=Metschnikowia bicuspidata TaxID=27322 RepID=A0A4P9ZD99_9ASCO|nr:DUF1687-domain-containing protein [Metschnikowia bicuspidata]